MKNSLWVSLALALVGAPSLSVAHHDGTEHGHKAKQMAQQHKGLGLSPELRGLLGQEMLQIKGGMESLVSASISGNWGQIASIGHQIKHSYILKQKLTAKQRHELHDKLPDEFKRLDEQLHYYAGMLAHVAQERDIELVNFYIYKMQDTCTACHSRFAKDKFAGFGMPNKHHQMGKHGKHSKKEGHHH